MSSTVSHCRRDDLVVVAIVVPLVLLLVTIGLGTITAPAAAADGAGNVSLYATAETEFDDTGSIEAAKEDGTVTDADQMVVGETLLVAIESDRLAADMDDRNGTPTERFFAVLEANATLATVQTNPSPQVPAISLDPVPENTTVYRGGNTTYVAVDTDGVDLGYYPPQDDPAITPEIGNGERFAVSIGYAIDEPPRTGPEVEFHDVEAELNDRSRTPYDPVAPELVNRSVIVNVDPRDAIEVRVTLEDGTTIVEEPSQVPWTGHHGVSLDFRSIAPGTNYTVELVHDGDIVDRLNGTVREPEASLWNLTTAIPEQERLAAELFVSAELSHGGYVQVVDEDGERLHRVLVAPETRREVPLRIVDAGARPDEEIPEDDPIRAVDVDRVPDELRIQAVRTPRDGGEQYPGPETELTIDADEIEWSLANETAEADGDDIRTDENGVGTDENDIGTDDTEDGATGEDHDEEADRTDTDETDTAALDDSIPGFGLVGVLAAVTTIAILLALGRRSTLR